MSLRLAAQCHYVPVNSNVRHQEANLAALHEYEAWLDEQDARVKLEGAEIVARFSRVYRFPLSACDTFEHAIFEARRFALLLLEEERANYSGLPARFLALAAAVRGWQIDSTEVYLPHSVVVLSRIAKIEQRRIDDRCYAELVSDDGHFFLRLSRAMNGDELFGPVHVEWPKIGYGTQNEKQFGDLTAVEVQRTSRYLVFSFPPETRWSTTRATSGDNAYYYRGTRLALEVQWTRETEVAALQMVAGLMLGLDFSNRCSNT